MCDGDQEKVKLLMRSRNKRPINIDYTFLVYLENKVHKLEYGDHSLLLYGTPWTAKYGSGWKAFQIPRETLSEKWETIPSNIDILVTHMPPFGVRDSNARGEKSGKLTQLLLFISLNHVFTGGRGQEDMDIDERNNKFHFIS